MALGQPTNIEKLHGVIQMQIIYYQDYCTAGNDTDMSRKEGYSRSMYWNQSIQRKNLAIGQARK